MIIESIRLSQRSKDQLMRIKRFTGIKHWNILCRWALCVSLSEDSPPPMTHVRADSNVEMTWKTFAGAHGPTFEALLRQNAQDHDIEPSTENLSRLLRGHLYRGVGTLGVRCKESICDLVDLVPGSA